VLLAATLPELRSWRRAARGTIGFVPTMGALHEGHLDLVRRAREENAAVVASIFVNPLQFGVGEDLARYPRDFAADQAKLEGVGTDLLFAPSTEDIYPPNFATSVDVGAIADTFEGAVRPGHFRGVATVVSKLLHLVHPTRLYLGQKDAQQCAVLRALVRDLAFDCEVATVRTTREPDGLALSSRNRYLSAAERAAAPSLHRVLAHFAELLLANLPAVQAREQAAALLEAPGRLDYLECVDADSFAPSPTWRENTIAVAAARFGSTRLLDNLWLTR